MSNSHLASWSRLAALAYPRRNAYSYKSVDYGVSWSVMNQAPTYMSTIVMNFNGTTIVGLNSFNVYMSTNGGKAGVRVYETDQ